MANPVLTIAIPTYNRAALLDTCLSAIAGQFGPVAEHVRVIVSSNASTDNTREIVEKYRSEFPLFSYYENESNVGPDLNIARCFELAATKYVWIFSDDDILLPATLAPIIELLQNNDLGLLSLTIAWYYQDIANTVIPDEPFSCRIIKDSIEFIEKVNYWTTFITGNIINKSLVAESATIYQFKNSNLIQLGWTLPAIFRSSQNAIVLSRVVLGRATAGVAYRFFKVFSFNFNAVLASLIKSGDVPPVVRDIINRRLITDFFPQYLHPENLFANNSERPFLMLLKVFRSYPEFWKILVPLFIQRLYATPVRRATSRIKNLVLNAFTTVSKSSAYHQSQRTARQLEAIGVGSYLPSVHTLTNPQCVSIGRRFSALAGLSIQAWEEYAGVKFEPRVVIGDDVTMGWNCSISCINQVSIGNHVLIGNQVIIADNAPDDRPAARALPPTRRPLRGVGPVIIGANVLIEDGVAIRSGVCIGENAVVKAGAVVSAHVPAHAIVAGNPAQEV